MVAAAGPRFKTGSRGEYRRLWVFACVFHDAVTLLEHKHTELRQHEYDRGLALGTECVISVMGLEY